MDTRRSLGTPGERIGIVERRAMRRLLCEPEPGLQ